MPTKIFAGLIAVALMLAYLLPLVLKLKEMALAGVVAIGVVTALFFHVMVNMLMTVGWAPVTGVPLPFLSYGGTALIVNCIQIGLLQNVALRRREY